MLLQSKNGGLSGEMKLEVKNIKKSFGDKEVLHGVSFEVESGKALGLLGRNGAGKTTTIRIIMDVFRANSGEILLDGEKFNPSKHLIGYLPEERGLYPKKTVTEQLVYLGRLRGLSKSEAKANTDKWLKRLKVSQYANAKLETLSKGNQQKVQLASTLVCNPEIVILDEPFSGLDPINSRILQDVVAETIDEGKIVIFSSHQMSYIEEFCDSIAIINAGKVAISGDLHKIKRNYVRDKLVVSTTKPEQIKADFGEVCTEREDGTLLIQLASPDDKQAAMKRLVENYDIDEVKVFEPSLNDIFVEYAGAQV